MWYPLWISSIARGKEFLLAGFRAVTHLSQDFLLRDNTLPTACMYITFCKIGILHTRYCWYLHAYEEIYMLLSDYMIYATGLGRCANLGIICGSIVVRNTVS